MSLIRAFVQCVSWTWSVSLCNKVTKDDQVQLTRGGGVLTGRWFTGMLKGLGCFFVIIGILMCEFPFKTQCGQFANLVVFRKIRPKKGPNLFQIGCFLRQFGIVMCHKIMLFEIEMVEVLKSTLSLPVRAPRTNFWRSPPPRTNYVRFSIVFTYRIPIANTSV